MPAKPDYRLKWFGANAHAVSVSGDWNGWATPGVPMERDEDGIFAADIFLPARCPRKNLIMERVCCYRYKFHLEAGARRRWLHDPRQPLDKDPDGWVNNFMCKYANSQDGSPLRMLPRASFTKPQGSNAVVGWGNGDGNEGGSEGGNDSTNDGGTTSAHRAVHPPRQHAPPPVPVPAVESCLVLPATYFNGTRLSAASTRGPGMCCDSCRRNPRCHAYNWRPEPLARNCVLFGRNYGSPRGTALSSAGLLRLPLETGA